ncbi:2-octaprenyl-6-methoxyphenyl hydroxylase [Vibrio sp. JC009]|uniref:2-octaprenyl-6-methoxyphenyl hydroxylase n=1 Tax=Vibrio sp. JC009 TaxID=2912314 RepID=UPI0023B1447D|nr:2-octaprenyl-6-methoxyphenyl hydroxylase [Vibrio sp. JC009]WED22231.1 2-octaprenyl-6-methoxyphenyl hydroxylase [Vibrio sp. JC009]
MKHYDIAIAGGAMAGATLALALSELSNRSFSIAVIEPYQADNSLHPGFDSRSIALSHGTVNILKSFSLWEGIKSEATAIRHIHVSDRGHAGMTDIVAADYAVDALGYVAELEKVGCFYHSRLNQLDNIDFLCPDSVSDIESFPDVVRVTLKSQVQFEANLLVAADGAVSHCCQLMKIENLQHDFNQTALIANISATEAHNGRAFERFTKNGPLALLPLTQDRMSLVWCLSPEIASQMMAVSDEEFLAQLQDSFGWRLGKLTQVGSRASYPLILKEKSKITSHRFATVGNAAQTLHPIAGQGFNLGIRDVASLAEELVKSDDPGAFRTLNRYQQRREDDRRSTIDLTAGLVHVFSNEWLPLVVGRNVSLMAMDNIPLLTKPLLSRTMGMVKR